VKLISTFALTALTLLGVACASGSPAATDGTTTPSTAPPSTTTPPTTTPPGTDAPVADPELPARPIDVDDGAFETIEDLGEGAELIVLGTVSDESPLGRPIPTNDPSADEFLGLTIRVESVLKGEPIGEVLLAWDAYGVDADGRRVATNVMNGIPVPHVGDQLLLFLRPVDDQFAALLDGFPTHTPVALDGIGFVEAGIVTITDDTAPNAAQLTGMTIDEISAQL
jgi:hypothetical protein